MIQAVHRQNVRRAAGVAPDSFEVYTARQFERIPHLENVPDEHRRAMRLVAQVLPFRVNRYVLDHLIDWDRVPEDPIFQLTFPQPGMLAPEDFVRLELAERRSASAQEFAALVHEIRARLNPHPGAQRELNVPMLDGRPVEGLQHKYRETVLFFPPQGQTCHSYCSFCFRWAQFVGDRELRFAARHVERFHRYLAAHREITDVLLTGGDPMVMKTAHLAHHLLALLEPEFEHVRTLRIGTKALTFWPQRFVCDEDADELLRLLEKLVNAGKHVALMLHYNHWRELESPVAHEAIRRLRDTGAILRSQGPVLRHINDDPQDWALLWRKQVQLGIQPYYMFIERDTGARRYFELPLARACEIYRDALRQVSGLARTARGPVMSAAPGKVEVQGVTEIHGERVFVLRFIQARDPSWVQRPFFARYDEGATWLDQLQPACGERRFFFRQTDAATRASA